MDGVEPLGALGPVEAAGPPDGAAWDPMSADGAWGQALSGLTPGLRRAMRAFVAGSSFPAIAVTLSYMAAAHAAKGRLNPALRFSFERFAVLLPVVFGVVNAAAQNADLTRVLGAGNYTLKMALVGAAVGLAFAWFGTFGGANLPQELFTFGIPSGPGASGAGEHVRRRALLFAPLLYAAIWGIIVAGVNVLMRTAQ